MLTDERSRMTTTELRSPTVYEMLVQTVSEWILTHTAKPLMFAFGALVSAVSGTVAGGVAIIAQLDLDSISPGQLAGSGAGILIVAWSVRFLHNVYQESLDVTRENLEAERADRAEDRAAFRAEIAARDETIAELREELTSTNEQLGQVLEQLGGIRRAQENGG